MMRLPLAFAVVLALAPVAADAWFSAGHTAIAQAAVEALPERVPEFFREGAEAVGHSAVDPDVEKLRELGELRVSEAPEHYFDRERFTAELPRSRYLFFDAIEPSGFRVADVGTLPYAILEDTQRLLIAFAEHRRWPDDPHVRARALMYAGTLSHYSGDLVQPLHTTVHHDGRAREDGSSPFSGIHRLVDGLLESGYSGAEGVAPVVLEDVHRAVTQAFDESHRLVDRVYELEPALRKLADHQASAAERLEIEVFARSRYEAGVRFTASLFLWAWDRSADLELPIWHDRGGESAE